MEKILTVLQVIAPIFVTVFLGILARRRQALAASDVDGLQGFVIKFCIPCLIFRSCLTAELTAEALTSMMLLPPILLICVVWAFRARKNQFPYSNFPMLFACKETGMLGIPLFVILFGAEQAYRVGVLDLAQAVIGFPVIGILSAVGEDAASPKAVLRQMAASPLIVLGILGVVLNLTGIWSLAQNLGVGPVVTETLSFLAQPVSAVMLFCVGYNFAMDRESRSVILRITALHVAVFVLIGLLIQGILSFLPNVDPLTRWAALLYCVLPTSYLTPGLGKSREDARVAAGVCSVTTVLCLAVFCVIAAAAA